jgi:NADPH2:quinone reductase
VVAWYPPADFGLRMFAAFQQSLSFATFSTDTVPGAERRAAIAGLLAAGADGDLRGGAPAAAPGAGRPGHQQLGAGEVFGRIVLVPRVLSAPRCRPGRSA